VTFQTQTSIRFLYRGRAVKELQMVRGVDRIVSDMNIFQRHLNQLKGDRTPSSSYINLGQGL
jgi:hypothetical protein